MPVLDIEKLEGLAQEYRIVFVGELSRFEWPERHRSTLEAIEELKNRKFDTYATSSEVKDEPWKAEARSLASNLREQASRSTYRNESTWRFACEPVILGRISSEVCCKNCRKRLWRSDIEVVQEDYRNAAEVLRRRQEAREPCRCPRNARSHDLLESTGLNPIFHFRLDEEVHHGSEISQKLGKAEKPDRVYGLRRTRNIENLLNDVAQRHFQDASSQVTKHVHEVIGRAQPLTQTGDHLLFPFLVLEAKSGNAGDSWHSIQMQTAFSIRTLLDTQDRLRKAAGDFSKWRSGPLVWFLANRGEDWRVCLCYTETVQSKAHTIGTTEYVRIVFSWIVSNANPSKRIIDVWNGSILSRDGALQLLLLVGYLFDWARDKYRNDIISELRILASGDNDTASTRYVDSDIYSTLQVDSRNHYLDEQSSEVDGVGMATTAQKAFNYDSSAGVIRHATFVESRFHAILVTKDNVQDLLRSTAQSKVRDLCKLIILLMKERHLVVKASDIDAIEWLWTGTRHTGWTYRHQRQPPYCALLSFCMYIDAKWHIVRELSVIAVTLDAWDDVLSASGLSKSDGESLEISIHESITSEKLIHAVKRLQAGSPSQILLSSINRRSLYLEMNKVNGNLSIQKDQGCARHIFHFIYMSAKKGVVEPEESFIRISKRLDQQNRLDSNVEGLFRNDAHVSEEGCVLVVGTSVPSDEDRLRRNVCVYLTAGDAQRPSNQELSLAIKRTYETRDVYHTTRNHGFPSKPTSPRIMLYRDGRKHLWNLQDTYGVHSQNFGFLNLLKKLGGSSPITQGSPRASIESGSQQYQRNFAPWQDFRGEPTYSEQRRFVLYKIFSQEIAFWRSTAKTRQAEGVRCCSCCAAVGSLEICQACQTILDDPNSYTWMKRCLKGETPFELTNPSADEMEEKLYFFQQYPGIKVFSMFQGTMEGRDDGDWARLLDFYPPLKKPFRDIQHLMNQWKDYEKYCLERKVRWRKRRRSSSDDEDSVSSWLTSS